eukprot:2594379-Rhodomonas_salina.1
MTAFRGSAGSPVSLPSDLRLCGRNWGRDLGIRASRACALRMITTLISGRVLGARFNFAKRHCREFETLPQTQAGNPTRPFFVCCSE